MSVKPYSDVTGPFFINKVHVPNQNKPFNKVFESSLEFANSHVEHPVHIHYFTSSPPVEDECRIYSGGIAHDGTASGILHVYADAEYMATSADVTDEDYVDKIPNLPFLMCVEGRVETEAVDRCFIIGGSIWGDYKTNTFKWKVQVADNARWARFNFPKVGQFVAIRGCLARREDKGIYVISMERVSLPDIKSTSPGGTPGSTPVQSRKRRRPKANAVEPSNGPSQFSEEGDGNAIAGPSGTSGDAAEPVTPSPVTRGQQGSRNKNKKKEDQTSDVVPQ